LSADCENFKLTGNFLKN